jgi:cbb3-type cytochrome oxidase subunit 3
MDTLLVKRFIDEAFKQSPHNGSDGYQFAMGTVAMFCVLLLAVIGFLYRDQKRERRRIETERKQARIDAARQIDKRFDGLRADINTGLDEMQKQITAYVGDTQKQHAAFREELTRLKTIIEIKGGQK